NADLVAVAPLHVGAQHLLLLRDVEIDHVRNADGVGEDEPGAGRRDVADEAIERRAAGVEIDAAAQEALLARRGAAFAHSAFSLGRQPREYRHWLNDFFTAYDAHPFGMTGSNRCEGCCGSW